MVVKDLDFLAVSKSILHPSIESKSSVQTIKEHFKCQKVMKQYVGKKRSITIRRSYWIWNGSRQGIKMHNVYNGYDYKGLRVEHRLTSSASFT